MTPLTQNLLAFFPPEDAKDFKIDELDSCQYLTYNGKWQFSLPMGSWSILGTANDGVPEFECEGLVEESTSISHSIYYRDYSYKSKIGSKMYSPMTAKESFSSLLHSCGCGVGRWLVLKKDEK